MKKRKENSFLYLLRCKKELLKAIAFSNKQRKKAQGKT